MMQGYAAPTRQHELDHNRSGMYLSCLTDLDLELGIDDLSVRRSANCSQESIFWGRCTRVVPSRYRSLINVWYTPVVEACVNHRVNHWSERSVSPLTSNLRFFLLLLLSSPFLSCSVRVVTQIRGHIVGSSPSSPLRYVPLHFYREKDSALSSNVDSRRILPINTIMDY